MIEGGRILIADDERTFRESTADLLRREGYHCDCASDAGAAIKMLCNTSYDVLIADIRMPGNAGLELVDELSRLDGDIPIILVTGYPSLDSAVRSVRLNVVGYMMKPLDFQNLLLHVRETTEKNLAHWRPEQGLRISVEQWRLAFDFIQDAVCLLSPEGRILRHNKAMSDLVGVRLREDTPHFCHDILRCDKKLTSQCPLVLARRSRRRESVLVPRSERTYKHIVDPLLGENGELIGAVHIMSDIEERGLAEDVVRNLAQAVSATTGATFFHSLVKYLGKTLGVDYAFVAELSGAGQANAVTLGQYADGEIAEDFEY